MNDRANVRHVSDLHRRIESARPEDVKISRDDVPAELVKLKAQIESDRRDNALERQLLVDSVTLLEERLRRIENSVLFRFNRAIGNVLNSQKRKLAHILRRRPFDFLRRPLADDGYARWVRFHEAAFPSIEWHHEQSRAWTWRPRISIVMATDHPQKERLAEAIASVRRQSYENWQLCICDHASGEAWIEEYLGSLVGADSRVKITLSPTRCGISGALNRACRLVEGDYVAFLRQDDVLHPHCLFYIAEVCQKQRVQVVYVDEDYLDPSGQRSQPRFKPDWSPDLLTSCMYWGHFWVAERDSIERVSDASAQWFRSGFDGAQDYDLALRLADAPLKVGRLARVLYHSRASPSARGGAASESSRRALEDALHRRNCTGLVERGSAPNTFFIRRGVPDLPLVSIVVCSRDLKLFEAFLHHLAERTEYGRLELILVEHQASPLPFPLKRLEAMWKRPLVHIPYAGGFNFAVMNNLAAKAANGSFLLFLNDDVEPVYTDWLRRMLGQIQRPEVGVVGARLLYPSGAIQHAGIALGMSLDGAGHPGRLLFHSDLFPWLDVTRNVTAVTGACLGIRKAVFDQFGGFDPQFPLDYNDVDLCLRASQQGYLVLYEAGAVLRHREAASRVGGSEHRERTIFHRRWSSLLRQPDPYIPPALDGKTEVIKLALWNGSGAASEGVGDAITPR